MATDAKETWLVAEIQDDVDAADASRVAHRLGGNVANDERIRDAIAKSLGNGGGQDAVLRVLGAVAAILKGA
jgi:hypothetical protein